MKISNFSLVACLCLLSLAAVIHAAEKDSPAVSPSPSPPPPRTVNDLYPGLTKGALNCAVASKLSETILLRAGTLAIHEKEVMQQIEKAPEKIRQKLKKNALFILEQIATLKLFLVEARNQAAKNGKDISDKDERQIIQEHVNYLTKKVKVSDAEIRDFFSSNTKMLGGASLAQIRPQIEQFLLQQKKQEFINQHVRTIGQRIPIQISASWLRTNAALAKDNPVDKARASGIPSLVDFGSTGCVPCDMMAPILDELGKKYKGKINVLFIHVGEEPILAERYGIQSIPVQVFFNKAGQEVFRNVGFFAKEKILAKWKELGVELK
jgi:thiol-disulfide isomerase/thioredoxin